MSCGFLPVQMATSMTLVNIGALSGCYGQRPRHPHRHRRPGRSERWDSRSQLVAKCRGCAASSAAISAVSSDSRQWRPKKRITSAVSTLTCRVLTNRVAYLQYQLAGACAPNVLFWRYFHGYCGGSCRPEAHSPRRPRRRSTPRPRGNHQVRHRASRHCQGKPQRGTVLAVGQGRRDDDGDRIAMDVKVGDQVLFAKYAGTEFKLDDADLLILAEKDILAIVAPQTGGQQVACPCDC